MEIIKPAMAGTTESSDCVVTIRPGQGKIRINLESSVKMMFGKSIMETIRKTLDGMDVTDADVDVLDRGALDCVIRARVQCAVCRAAESPYNWDKEEACHV